MEKNKIFISHRHSDTQSDSFALKAELQKYFGEDNVFLDFKNLVPGTKFADHINSTLKESRVVLVVIGPDWQGPKNEDGVTRLFEKEDWVRREVAAALADPHSHVIPVLVKNAKEPLAKDLPDDLKTLAELQTIEINIKRWEYDVNELVKVLEKFLPKKHNLKAQITPEPQSNPRPYVAPIPQQKSWWAKNYLWVLGGFVGFMILIQMCSNLNNNTIPDVGQEVNSDTLVSENEGDFTENKEATQQGYSDQPVEPNSDNPAQEDLRNSNPNGNEIYNSLTFQDTPDFSGKWWLRLDGLRSGYYQITQNGNEFSFVSYYFDSPIGQGVGVFEDGVLYSTNYTESGNTDIGFAFTYDQTLNQWVGKHISKGVENNATLSRNP